jgi:hypothetical protein
VDLADQTLTAPVADDGSWSVTSDALADGPHRVVMSITDGAGNSARLVQTLTVDTVAPAIAIDGGSAATTFDLTPTISGTSDAAPGSTVPVSIAGQTLTALVQANGSWNATPTKVGTGGWPVVATVPDPAGNVGRAQQTLTTGGSVTLPLTAPIHMALPDVVSATLKSTDTLATAVIVKCPTTVTVNCVGSMLVYAKRAGAAKHAKMIRIGRYHFNIKPGAKSRLVVNLNARGKRLLAHAKKLKATLVATTFDASGKRVKATSHTTLRVRH